jgi:O-antigen/teichoic acid export membrane protein
MLGFSIPLVPSRIGVFVFSFIDRIAIKQLMTLNDVGLYGVGFRLASTITLLTSGAQMAMTPIVYAHYKDETFPADLERIFRYLLVFALTSYLGLVIFSRDIMIFFTTPLYYDAAGIVPLLVPSVFLSGIYIFAPGLWITKQTKLIAIINIFAAVLNTILNFLMIPVLGINGAALATLLSAAVVFAIYQWYTNKCYPIPYQWKRVFSAMCLVVAILGCNWLLSYFYAGQSGMILIKIVIVVIGTIAVTLTLVDIEELRSLLTMAKSEINVIIGKRHSG